VGWIIATVRGVRRMDAQERYRSRRDAPTGEVAA